MDYFSFFKRNKSLNILLTIYNFPYLQFRIIQIFRYNRKEEDENNEYYDCYNGQIENFYLDNNIYKRCFKTCKNCNELGDNLNHKCIDCYSNYTLNNSNCYEICNYFYYFDKNDIYHCTEKDECPSEFPNKIVDKKICVSKCTLDKYKKLIVDKKECVE